MFWFLVDPLREPFSLEKLPEKMLEYDQAQRGVGHGSRDEAQVHGIQTPWATDVAVTPIETTIGTDNDDFDSPTLATGKFFDDERHLDDQNANRSTNRSANRFTGNSEEDDLEGNRSPRGGTCSTHWSDMSDSEGRESERGGIDSRRHSDDDTRSGSRSNVSGSTAANLPSSAEERRRHARDLAIDRPASRERAQQAPRQFHRRDQDNEKAEQDQEHRASRREYTQEHERSGRSSIGGDDSVDRRSESSKGHRGSSTSEGEAHSNSSRSSPSRHSRTSSTSSTSRRSSSSTSRSSISSTGRSKSGESSGRSRVESEYTGELREESWSESLDNGPASSSS